MCQIVLIRDGKMKFFNFEKYKAIEICLNNLFWKSTDKDVGIGHLKLHFRNFLKYLQSWLHFSESEALGFAVIFQSSVWKRMWLVLEIVT